MCSLACSQNKGLSKYQRRASQLHTGPSPSMEAERQACNSHSWKARGNLGSRDQHPPPNCEQAPSSNHVFLGSWTVNICQEGHSQRSAPQKSYMAHLRWCSRATPRKAVARTDEVIKIHGPPGTVCSPSTWSPELLRPGKDTKHTPNQVCALAEYLRN